MGFYLVRYLCLLSIYTLLLWFGLDQANMPMPSLTTAPWLWGLLAVAPLIPTSWSCWDWDSSGWDVGD